jgi:hypothetical protein
VQGAHGVVGTASGPKAIRAVQKVLLVNGLQHLAHRILDQLVLECGNPQGPCFAIVLGNVNTSDRLVTIAFRLQPLVQILHVGQQVLPVILLGDLIHAHRSILTLSVIRTQQGRHTDEMCQRMKLSVGFLFGSFRYLQKLRGHAFPSRSLAHVSLPKFVIHTGCLCSASFGVPPRFLTS